MSDAFSRVIEASLSAPVATLIASLLGAFVLYLTNRRTAANQAKLAVAEFRLDWIQRLREALSEFQSIVMLPESDAHKERRFYETGTTIELLLNRNEPEHQKLMDHMYVMFDAANGSLTQKFSTNPEFVELSQDILKTEWDRARRDLLGKKHA